MGDGIEGVKQPRFSAYSFFVAKGNSIIPANKKKIRFPVAV